MGNVAKSACCCRAGRCIGKLTPRQEFIHDLALAFGTPALSLARQLTEREFVQWQRYAAQKMLPQRRIELMLAQIAQLIAVTMGGAKNTKLTDYLFDAQQEQEMTAEEFFDFQPRVKN